ncbi:LysR family transcriptional regulator [Saccharopolyspora taberi]|uniref:LysR family transcriptional regulator n=1 Tax=Saccharopolyspora taberi TaxID=60895 RepID=A0ABN3VJ58_9PSEU
MNLRALQWFVVLADAEHMTAAAERLHITQPTLSRAMARLERRLGTRLFDRTPHGLRLNRYGEVLRAHAHRALGELNSAEERIATLIDPDRGTVSLSYLYSLGAWLVPELLRGYRGQAPGVRFVLTGGAADVILEDLRSGRVDVILTSPRPDADDVLWTEIDQQEVCLATSVDHPLACRERISLAEAADEDFIAMRPEFGLRQVAEELWQQAGFRPTLALESTELATVRGLVGHGLGVAIVPAPRDGDGAQRLRYLRLDDPGARRPVGAAVIAGQHQPPAVRRFCAFVRGRADS